MRLWAIKGYDDLYGGLHGMCSLSVIEVDTEKEASEFAQDLAADVVQGYTCIEEELEDSIQCECEADDIPYGQGTEEEEAIRDEIYAADAVYEVWELDVDKLPTTDVDELSEMYYNQEEEFLNQFRLG